MDHVEGILSLLGERFETFSKSDVVVGSPIELGSATVVPLSRVSVGMGAGGGVGEGRPDGKHGKHGKHGPGKGKGGGGGGGAKVRPVAVAVFTADGVEVLPIPNRRGKLDKLLDNLPELIERVKKIKDGASDKD